MCDWGGGPNSLTNYIDHTSYEPEPRTVRCMFNVEGNLHACGQKIEGFTGSTIYGPERDPVMQEHLRTVKHARTLEEILSYRAVAAK
jgi:hypothetical protein